MEHSAGTPPAGTPLQQRLEAAGVTLRELHRRTGIALGTLSRTVNGERAPNAGESALIAGVLGEDGLEGASHNGDKSQRPDTPEPDAGEDAQASPPPAPTDQYPAAPADPAQRRAYFNARNAALQDSGAKPARGITFGAKS